MACCNKLKKYIKTWGLTKIDNKLSFDENAIVELQEYFNCNREKANYWLMNGEENLVKEWNEHFKNKKFEKNLIIEFYNKTKTEIYELMHWNYIKYLEGPLRYVFALDIAKRCKFKNFLDYGSGIGTGAILFAINNFNVTLADVSSTNLDFCRYRFKKRLLIGEFIDLKFKGAVNNTKYDIITCFDVLEHVYDPIETLALLRSTLGENGLLIINAEFYKDEKRPMHIITNRKIVNRIRAIGFSYRRDLMKECYENIRKRVLVLERVNRHFIANKLYLIYDNILYFLRKYLMRIRKRFKGRFIWRLN